MTVLKLLGAKIEDGDNRLAIQGISGKPRIGGDGTLDVGESGTLLRFTLPLSALAEGDCTINGSGSLLKRPNREIVDALRQGGVDIAGVSPEHMLPIQIKAKGTLEGGEISIDGGRGSQAVSALLITSPFTRADTTLVMEKKLVSRPYVDVTIDVLKWAGIKVDVTEDKTGRERFFVKKGQEMSPKSDFVVHGDFSSAAFLMAAAVLLESDLIITDLVDDCQGDQEILNILTRMGARLEHTNDAVTIQGPHELQGVEIDCRHTPDLVPILTVLGCFAKGETKIRNVTHLAFKESNRVAEPAGQLMHLGADISYTSGEIIIKNVSLHSGSVSSCGDHRVAMALAVAGLGIGGEVLIEGSECISKSYPGFVSDMQQLGAKMRNE